GRPGNVRGAHILLPTRLPKASAQLGRLSDRLARYYPIRCDGRSGEPRQSGVGRNRIGGTNGPDPDYYNIGPPLRGRLRLSPVGIWRRPRYRRYSADRARRLSVVWTR